MFGCFRVVFSSRNCCFFVLVTDLNHLNHTEWIVLTGIKWKMLLLESLRLRNERETCCTTLYWGTTTVCLCHCFSGGWICFVYCEAKLYTFNNSAVSNVPLYLFILNTFLWSTSLNVTLFWCIVIPKSANRTTYSMYVEITERPPGVS